MLNIIHLRRLGWKFSRLTPTRGEILHALCPTTSSSSQETADCNHFGFTSQFDPYFRRRRFLFSGLGPWGNAAAITFSPSESARLERLPIREGWAVSSHIDPIFFCQVVVVVGVVVGVDKGERRGIPPNTNLAYSSFLLLHHHRRAKRMNTCTDDRGP